MHTKFEGGFIRNGSIKDKAALAEVEAACFPAEEAAGEAQFSERLHVYPDWFWILEKDGQIVGFINGIATDAQKICDEMFAEASYHDPEGQWYAVFGVDTLPDYQGRGIAARLMRRVIEDVRLRGKKGCILTCKEKLIPFYEQFGYKNEGLSESVHGGAVWYDMRLTF